MGGSPRSNKITGKCQGGIALEDSQASNQPVGAHTEVLVVDTALAGVHVHEGVADDVLEERAGVDLAEDEAERVGVRVAEHDELVARERLVEVQLVRRRLVVDELLVPACGRVREEGRSGARARSMVWGT